jgi:hypothetical protein
LHLYRRASTRVLKAYMIILQTHFEQKQAFWAMGRFSELCATVPLGLSCTWWSLVNHDSLCDRDVSEVCGLVRSTSLLSTIGYIYIYIYFTCFKMMINDDSAVSTRLAMILIVRLSTLPVTSGTCQTHELSSWPPCSEAVVKIGPDESRAEGIREKNFDIVCTARSQEWIQKWERIELSMCDSRRDS